MNIDEKKCLEVNTQRELVLAEYQKENDIDEFGNVEECVFGKLPEMRLEWEWREKGMVQFEVGDGAIMMCENVL